ncbi:MAG TPA: PASTA domain-containing protein [Gemmatimonadaceae bacterium]|nr:PASTA domain-containing protein [Gemmatimonadaceae bacterium]
MRETISRHPFIVTAVSSFAIGFVIVALLLLPGALARGESAVPNVVGLLYTDAAAQLTAAGFTTTVGESIHHATAPRNSVLGQSPAPGVKAAKGNEIQLDVSLGAKKGTVPNVVGMSRVDATKALEDAGFDLASDYTERLDRRPRGEVLNTTPRPGVTLQQPASVRLTVSAGPDAIGVPSLVGMPVEDALALLGQLGLVAGATRYDSSGTQPEGFVSGQRPSANAPTTPGATVTLTVSRPRQPLDSLLP